MKRSEPHSDQGCATSMPSSASNGHSTSLWVCEPVGVRTCECASLWVCKPVDVRACGCVTLWVCEPLEVRAFGCTSLWVCGPDTSSLANERSEPERLRGQVICPR